MLNRDCEIEVWSRFVWNLWYELNPRSVVPLAMFINKEDTKTIIANQLEGILIGLAMFLWHHNIISIVECSVVLLSTLTELVTKLLERQLFSCVLTQCNFKQTSTESLSNKQKEFKDKVVSVTKKRKRRKVYYICWVIQIGLIILRRQVQVARGRSPGDGQRWEQKEKKRKEKQQKFKYLK